MRGLGWLSYASGLAHLQLASQSFAGVETREQLDHAAKYSYRSSPAVVAAGVRAMMNWDASDVLGRVTVPTLIITGTQDTTTLPEASVVMKREIRQSSLVTVDPAAHLGPIEQHERYATELRAFADRVTATDERQPRAMAPWFDCRRGNRRYGNSTGGTPALGWPCRGSIVRKIVPDLSETTWMSPPCAIAIVRAM